jgi:hypothetical protein
MMAEKARLDGTPGQCWAFYNTPAGALVLDRWLEAAKKLDDSHMQWLWQTINPGASGGGRKEHWEPSVINLAAATISTNAVSIIPAIREIGAAGSTSTGFEGKGIIERLAKLQNPGALEQKNREKFREVTEFFREVTGNSNAELEVPFERNTIIVHMQGKSLPIESLGSGLHEVLILAAAATVLSDHLVCIEEPELHLNPLLQKKLLRYLSAKTSNQYFITTHSAASMDVPDAELYHVRMRDGASAIERVTTGRHRSSVCEDLGYHPSDLVQANCIIWVEGPSDRLYINWWLRSIDSSLTEGIHYSVMFYGGRLAAHLSNADDEEVEKFISLRRLNRRGVMLMDSDRRKPHSPLNATKRRLSREFDLGPGHAWITAGREIENYLAPNQLLAGLNNAVPSAKPFGGFGRYDSTLAITRKGGKSDLAPKVAVAHYITDHFDPDLSNYDLRQQLGSLKKFILDSNPS